MSFAQASAPRLAEGLPQGPCYFSEADLSPRAQDISLPAAPAAYSKGLCAGLRGAGRCGLERRHRVFQRCAGLRR